MKYKSECYQNILIYGAHLVALEYYRQQCSLGKRENVLGFAVTDRADNPKNIDDKPVRCISEYADAGNDCLVVIAMPKRYHDEAEQYARNLGFCHFQRVSLESISEQKASHLIESNVLPFELHKSENDPTWLDVSVEQRAGVGHCKFPTLFYLETKDVLQQSRRLLEAYHSQMDGVASLSELSDDFTIYMAFDESAARMVEDHRFAPWIRPLQVGCDRAKKTYTLFCDNQGTDHISGQNGLLAEMTGAYWIWKYAPRTAYKGLCHYRRHFILTEADIRKIQTFSVDAILTTPRFVPGGIQGMFLAETPVKPFVMETMRQALASYSQSEEERFSHYLKTEFYFPNNMVVAKSDIYDAYCEWIFPFLFRMMELDEEMRYGHQDDRHLAYAAELLTSYYFMKRKDELRIVYTDYEFIMEA